MSRRRTISRAAFAGAAAAAAGAAAAPSAQAQFAQQQASVAVICPMSGPQKDLGTQFVSGVRAALDDANGTRGLLDRFWMMRTFDDQNALAPAMLQSRFAIDDSNQLLAIGHLSGKITDQTARYYAEAIMPLIVPASTTDSITSHGYRTVFRLPTKDSVEGILHAVYVKREGRGRRIAVVYLDGDYGYDVANGFLQRAKSDGLNPFDVKLPHDKPDFASAARNIVAQGADLVFLAGIARELGPIVPLLRGAGFTGAFDGSAAFFDGGLWPSYGKAIDGLTVSTSMPPLQIVPSAYAIKNEFEQRYGPMGPIAAFTYAATQIFIAAVRRGQVNSRTLLARTIAQPIAFDTLVGSFTFDAFGDPNDPNVYYYQLSNGNWRYLRAAHPSSFIVR